VIPPFALARPGSLGEAFDAYANAGGDAAWYAGGTELLQVMKMGLARFEWLIDLKGLPELRGIRRHEDGSLVVGAGVTHRELERNALVRQEAPGLAELEGQLANVRVRNQGTIGGNLCFAEPHSDPATFLLACDARLSLRGPHGTREVPVREFTLGPFVTAREPDEILLAVVLPKALSGEGRAYAKAKFRERPAVSVAVRVRVAGGAIADARVAVGALTEAPLDVPDAARALVGAPADAAALEEPLDTGSATLGRLDAVADLDGSADYKRHLAGVLLRRATRAALREAVAGG
jgi:carbon-monoxide dehydrogenase medium subunit